LRTTACRRPTHAPVPKACFPGSPRTLTAGAGHFRTRHRIVSRIPLSPCLDHSRGITVAAVPDTDADLRRKLMRLPGPKATELAHVGEPPVDPPEEPADIAGKRGRHGSNVESEGEEEGFPGAQSGEEEEAGKNASPFAP